MIGQVHVELGLAEQHNLQELVGRGFQIGQQPQKFQVVERDALRFFDKHHDTPSGFVAGQQGAVELCQPCLPAAFGRVDAEVSQNRRQHVVGRQGRIAEVNTVDAVGQMGNQLAAQHGLAAADFAHHLDDAFALTNGIEQGGQHFPALAAGIPVLGIRRDAKGRFV